MIIHGDSAQELKKFKDNSIDAVVTDPPYGIEFLAKEWDSNTGAVEIWSECFRVLKPGGYLLAFSAARTYHHLATNIESVGFEIRDQIMWLYASGFPKAQDIATSRQRRPGDEKTIKKERGEPGGFDNWVNTQENKNVKRNNQTINETIPTSPEAKQWAGWKTALKPAHEPICMARKPFKGSTIDNVLTHGVGALNIDATRIPFENEKDYKSSLGFDDKYDGVVRDGGPLFQGTKKKEKPHGTKRGKGNIENFVYQTLKDDEYTPNDKGRFPSNVLGEVEGYQKFFYCPKVSRKERHKGFEQALTNPQMLEQMGGYYCDAEGKRVKDSGMCYVNGPGKIYVHGLKHEYEQWCKKNKKDSLAQTKNIGNNHPTVKPVELMRYLVQLVTPQGAHVLDPFCGSGSTGMACKELGNKFTGIEQDKNYVTIAQQRIDATLTDPKHTLFE